MEEFMELILYADGKTVYFGHFQKYSYSVFIKTKEIVEAVKQTAAPYLNTDNRNMNESFVTFYKQGWQQKLTQLISRQTCWNSKDIYQDVEKSRCFENVEKRLYFIHCQNVWDSRYESFTERWKHRCHHSKKRFS